jgi:hypothetical protein
MNKWLSSVAFLLVVGVSASEAQFSPAPIINPGIRPGTGPSFTPYGAGFGGYGSPFGGYGSPFGGYGSPYGGGFGPTYGGGFGPGGNLAFGSNLAGAGVVSPYGNTGIVIPQGNITGHPTRFNSYSQYFNNPGTGLITNVLTTDGSPLTTPAGVNSRINSTIGSRPQQGPANPMQP